MHYHVTQRLGTDPFEDTSTPLGTYRTLQQAQARLIKAAGVFLEDNQTFQIVENGARIGEDFNIIEVSLPGYPDDRHLFFATWPCQCQAGETLVSLIPGPGVRQVRVWVGEFDPADETRP